MNGAVESVPSLLPCLAVSVLLGAASDEMMANPAKARRTAKISVRHCPFIVDGAFFAVRRLR